MHVGITKDLSRDISYFASQHGTENVAHIRALSFSYPQKATMEEFANGWRLKVIEAKGGGGADDGVGWGMVPSSLDEDDEDEDEDDDMDEDDLDDYLQMMAESRAAVSSSPSSAFATASTPLFVDNTGLSNIVSLATKKEMPDAIISPFEAAATDIKSGLPSAIATMTETPSLHDGEPLELGIENVDKVLDEVRPYLISDGGNVCVQNVDVETGNVYLLLEGACGSCASSTVTMKMGIERVLREKFGERLGEVIQVDPAEAGDGNGGKASELTIEAVQAEVNRMSQAITAMGGVVRVVGVDPIGVAEIEYRGPNRVKRGLELALLDVEFVKHVKFVS